MSERADGGRIRLELDRSWAELVLDHPRRRNAMTPSMVADLERAVKALEGEPPPALLLRGEGGLAFCAGSDLRLVRRSLDRPDLALQLCREMTDLLARLQALPALRAVAVEGAAVGGGAELALVGHRIFMSSNAVFGFVQASLGVSPGWGGGRRLAERVGARRAAIILAESRSLPAGEALEAGLIDVVAAPGAAVAEARAWLAAITRRAPAAVRAAVMVAAAADPSIEGECFARLWGGPAQRAAFGLLDES